MDYEAIVIGVSSGGINALKFIFYSLPKDFLIPIIIVIHIGPHAKNKWISILNKPLSLTIDEKVNFARPSIDVLFESASEAYKNKLTGIISQDPIMMVPLELEEYRNTVD